LREFDANIMSVTDGAPAATAVWSRIAPSGNATGMASHGTTRGSTSMIRVTM
jgi:hypothetical protein